MVKVRSTKEEAKDRFMSKVYTEQYMKQGLKNTDNETVFISQREIEKVYFVHPYHNRKQCLYELQQEGKLQMVNIAPATKTAHARYEYRALRAFTLDLSLCSIPDQSRIGPGGRIMRENLKRVSLPADAPSTEYFDFFLQYKDQAIEHFFTVDAFAARVHTPITNFHRAYRANLLIDSLPTVGLDVATMQPLLLGKILKKLIGVNDFSDWIERGEDVYIMLQKYANLETRDQGKKRFFEIIFAPPTDELAKMFGQSDWINWINRFKTLRIPENPRNLEKPHNNLSWILQRAEVKLMHKVWKQLNEAGIVFLSIHDEIMVKENDRCTAESIMRSILDNEFKFYQLNIKQSTIPDLSASPASVCSSGDGDAVLLQTTI